MTETEFLELEDSNYKKNIYRRNRRSLNRRKYFERKKKWKEYVPRSVRNDKSFKEYRLKRSGNPFNMEAIYRGDREFRLDWRCVSKTPYQYTKSEWKAKELDKEIDRYNKEKDFHEDSDWYFNKEQNEELDALYLEGIEEKKEEIKKEIDKEQIDYFDSWFIEDIPWYKRFWRMLFN